MISVTGTLAQGVLVSVSVSAVTYTRILVSDRIGACPYRPFSRHDGTTTGQDRASLPQLAAIFSPWWQDGADDGAAIIAN